MKIVKIAKEVLVKSLIGFPIGATMLIIGYVLVYFSAGESVFQEEISKLQDIHILIKQTFALGVSYYILCVFFRISVMFDEDDFIRKMQLKYPYRTVFVFGIICLLLVIPMVIFLIILNSKTFSDGLRDLNLSLLYFTLPLKALVMLPKEIRQSKLIERINEKIKERHQ